MIRFIFSTSIFPTSSSGLWYIEEFIRLLQIQIRINKVILTFQIPSAAWDTPLITVRIAKKNTEKVLNFVLIVDNKQMMN